MHPMTAMRTPGRCPVRAWILAVVSCRSKRVRPHEGQLMYSVFVTLILEACRRLNDDSRSASGSMPPASQSKPSPRPSMKRLPNSAEASMMTSSSSLPSGYLNHSTTGRRLVASIELSTEKKRRPRNATPSWLAGLNRMRRGSAFSTARSITSADSSPEKVRAWPPSRNGSGPSTAAPGWRMVTPSGAWPPAGASTPTGTSRRSLRLGRSSSVRASSTTTASALFQSFCTSPSARRRRPKRLHRFALSSWRSSWVPIRVKTEPSWFRGTSTGYSHLRLKKPSLRAATSSNAGTPLSTAASATERSVAVGCASYSGSSVRDTRIVSPIPSSSSAPIPTADLMRPSGPPPASVTPRCSG
mmetsp:Transcript_105233/g.297816  ORF Transcript_105233/g.297816 Transcript_105233/m.297816 type:complete len:357 (-) Transcript_105233:26-1096(-)